jgi:hypothetical protein
MVHGTGIRIRRREMSIHGVAGVRRQEAQFKLIQPEAVLLAAAVVLLVMLLLMIIMRSIVIIVMVAVVVLPMLLFSRIGVMMVTRRCAAA